MNCDFDLGPACGGHGDCLLRNASILQAADDFGNAVPADLTSFCRCGPGWSGVGDFVRRAGRSCDISTSYIEAAAIATIVISAAGLLFSLRRTWQWIQARRPLPFLVAVERNLQLIGFWQVCVLACAVIACCATRCSSCVLPC